VCQAAQNVLALLHADGFVHGDMRETNIMIKKDGVDNKDLGDIILIDFDWPGKECGGWICSAHDDEMLEFLSWFISL